MVNELFREDFYLSTSEPKEVMSEKLLLEIHKDKLKAGQSKKDLLNFFRSSGKGSMLHEKKSFQLKNSKGKTFVVYIRYKDEAKLQNKDQLDEDIYQNLKYEYKDLYKVILPDDDE